MSDAALHDPSEGPGARCANCDASLQLELVPRFCPQCGQETTLHAPTLAEFAHEFVGHFVAVEGTLWRTLRMLVTAPGKLTTEYFAGRRRRYVAPLRLYLSASFVFFLAAKIALASGTFSFTVGTLDAHGGLITKARDPVQYQQTQHEMRRCLDAPATCGWGERVSAGIGTKLMQLSDHENLVGEHMIAMAPYAFILLLPLLAGAVMLVYRRRHMAYGAHFVFALHTYSFSLLVLAIAALLPSAMASWSTLIVLGYALWAMHVVYGGRWAPTFLRFAVVALLFGAALTVAEVALSVASIILTDVA